MLAFCYKERFIIPSCSLYFDKPFRSISGYLQIIPQPPIHTDVGHRKAFPLIMFSHQSHGSVFDLFTMLLGCKPAPRRPLFSLGLNFCSHFLFEKLPRHRLLHEPCHGFTLFVGRCSRVSPAIENWRSPQNAVRQSERSFFWGNQIGTISHHCVYIVFPKRVSFAFPTAFKVWSNLVFMLESSTLIPSNYYQWSCSPPSWQPTQPPNPQILLPGMPPRLTHQSVASRHRIYR